MSRYHIGWYTKTMAALSASEWTTLDQCWDTMGVGKPTNKEELRRGLDLLVRDGYVVVGAVRTRKRSLRHMP